MLWSDMVNSIHMVNYELCKQGNLETSEALHANAKRLLYK